MKSTRIPHLLLAFCLCLCVLHGRTFTSNQGDKLEAEYVNLSGDNALLKTPAGQQLSIPLDSFCKDDQLYLSYRFLQDTLKRDGPLRLKMRENKGKVSQSEQGGVTISKWDASYKVSLENLTSLPLDNLVVQYGVFKLAAEAGGATASSGDILDMWGQTQIPLIGARRTAEFETQSIPMRSLKLKSNYYWAGGGKRRNSDDLKGLWVRVYWKDLLILEYKSSQETLADESWPKKLAAPQVENQRFKQ